MPRVPIAEYSATQVIMVKMPDATSNKGGPTLPPGRI
jgi:hypothetical protein